MTVYQLRRAPQCARGEQSADIETCIERRRIGRLRAFLNRVPVNFPCAAMPAAARGPAEERRA
jgi:hypothetical protein